MKKLLLAASFAILATASQAQISISLNSSAVTIQKGGSFQFGGTVTAGGLFKTVSATATGLPALASTSNGWWQSNAGSFMMMGIYNESALSQLYTTAANVTNGTYNVVLKFTYAVGNHDTEIDKNVTVDVVPEPAPILATVFGLTGLLWRRRRS